MYTIREYPHEERRALINGSWDLMEMDILPTIITVFDQYNIPIPV